MNKEQLRALLDAEIKAWSSKSYSDLVEELPDVVAYGRGSDAGFHQFEVLMLEHEPEYVHVSISIDDASLLKSFSPLTGGFIVHRDGRVEK